MATNATETVHQGELIEEYRKRKNWSREKLAAELRIDTSTVYRMEQQHMIRNLERRRMLIGLLGIPATLMGLHTDPDILLKPIKMNNDYMAFYEEGVAIRWDIYHTGGTGRAYRGLDLWLQGSENFAREAAGTAWQGRANATLVMSYQLQGSIFRDMMRYDQAHTSYEKAYKVAEEANDTELMAAALARRGVTCIQQNIPREAIEYLNSAQQMINGMGLPCLRGYILQALSEAYGQEKQEHNSRHYLNLAEGASQRCGEILERSHCQLNTTSITAQRGVNAVWLGDYERAAALIDKGLLKYDPTLIRGRARLIAQKAEALYGLQHITECAMIAEEAFVLAKSVGSMKTIARIKILHASLAQSRWKGEPGVARLGALLWRKQDE
jgi:tetratricopeptide (TPR) repeat protein